MQEDYRQMAVAKLAASLLDAGDAARLGLQLVNGDDLKRVGLPHGVAIEIPYFDITGHKINFSRFRYLSDIRTEFEKVAKKKPIRYLQPRDTKPYAYFPPYTDWQAIRSDARQQIIITEGEFKAACASKHGFDCIGLGGVWSFRRKKDFAPLIDDLVQFEFKGRDVFIVFDSDARSNPQVLIAQNALAKELTDRGASVRIANLPHAANGARQGIDDFIVAEGPQKFALLLHETPEYAVSKSLHELNEQVVYIRDPGMVIEIKTGQKMFPAAFASHHYANKRVAVEVTTTTGRKTMKQRPIAQAWIEWGQRSECRKVVYRPGDEKFTSDGCYNNWNGWGCEPLAGDVTPWVNLLDHLFKGYPDSRDWFERWIAYPIQHPGTKMYTACLLWSVATGVGKSLIGDTLKFIYGENYAAINDSHLEGRFNEWASTRQFVMGDDITGQDNRKYRDRLKSMITQTEVWIDSKYIPVHRLQDCINYLLNSNQPDAVYVEEEDRRYFVHEIVNGPLPPEIWKPYRTWMLGDGPRHLFAHLLALDLKGMTAQDRAPFTVAKGEMIQNSASDLARWVRLLRVDPDQVLRIGMAVSLGDLWSIDDLLEVYSRTHSTSLRAPGMGRELKRGGVKSVYEGKAVRTDNGHKMLYAIRNPERWLKAGHAEIAEHYNKTRIMKLAGRS